MFWNAVIILQHLDTGKSTELPRNSTEGSARRPLKLSATWGTVFSKPFTSAKYNLTHREFCNYGIKSLICSARELSHTTDQYGEDSCALNSIRYGERRTKGPACSTLSSSPVVLSENPKCQLMPYKQAQYSAYYL